ncbi:MAG: acetolactate decarboxylase, partial [Pedobacter sp.]|nr:acetolactate decarboxylase [Chitinophagaceae bacterium]
AFATYFKADTSFIIDETLSQQELYKKLLSIIQPNQTYAINITGVFDSLKLRSVPKQQPPFILLSDAVKYQTIFNIPTIKGTMIGFLTPNFAAALNVVGFHFHFLNDEATKGGHVLNSTIKKATIQIARMTAIELQLPNSKAFNQLNLSGVDKEQLYKAEH